MGKICRPFSIVFLLLFAKYGMESANVSANSAKKMDGTRDDFSHFDIPRRNRTGQGVADVANDETAMTENAASPADFLNFEIFRGKRTFRGKIKTRVASFEAIKDFSTLGEGEKKSADVEGKSLAYDADPNYCRGCDVHFRYENHYVNHRARVHGDAKPRACSICGNGFAIGRSVKLHVKRCHPEEWRRMGENSRRRKKKKAGTEMAECDVCGKACQGALAYVSHVIKKHHLKLVSCRWCGMEFSSYSGFHKHVRIKHPKLEDAFLRCDVCGFNFGRSDVMEKHKVRCYERKERNKGINKMEITDLATATLRKYCGICDLEFQCCTHYRKHCKQRHPGDKIYDCEYCDKSYTTVYCLDIHVKAHHERENLADDDDYDDDVMVKKFRKGRTYACEHCGEEIKGVTKYERHGRLRHPERKIFHCGHCREGFARKSSMKRHVKEKHGDDKIKCAYCTRCYSRKDELKLHERNCDGNGDDGGRKGKKGVRPRYCGICKRTMYVKKVSFDYHVATHDKFAYCDVCGQRYDKKRPGYRERMTRHRAERHPCQANINALLRTAAAEEEAKNRTLKAESRSEMAEVKPQLKAEKAEAKPQLKAEKAEAKPQLNHDHFPSRNLEFSKNFKAEP